MDKGTLFWICMLIWLIFGVVPPPASVPAWRYGGILLLFILLALLGWKVFGDAVH